MSLSSLVGALIATAAVDLAGRRQGLRLTTENYDREIAFNLAIVAVHDRAHETLGLWPRSTIEFRS